MIKKSLTSLTHSWFDIQVYFIFREIGTVIYSLQEIIFEDVKFLVSKPLTIIISSVKHVFCNRKPYFSPNVWMIFYNRIVHITQNTKKNNSVHHSDKSINRFNQILLSWTNLIVLVLFYCCCAFSFCIIEWVKWILILNQTILNKKRDNRILSILILSITRFSWSFMSWRKI